VADNSWNGYEHNLLFECLGDGQYADVARPLGCDAIEDSRALAVADLNNDGQLDLIVANNDDPPSIFLNRLGSAGNWLRVGLTGPAAKNRDAIGARVRVTIDHEGQPRKMTRWVECGSGYAAQSDMRLHFGLGTAETLQSLEVLWPDGTLEVYTANKLKGICNGDIWIEQGVDGIQRLPVLPARRLPVSNAAQSNAAQSNAAQSNAAQSNAAQLEQPSITGS